MPSQITDLLDRVTDSNTGRPVISALANPGKAIGAASLTVADATNWSTSAAIHFSIYEVTAAGYKDPTTQTDWKGTLSGTTISSLVLTGGTDRAYSTGAKIELTPTARYAKDLYDWGITHANPDGTLKTTAVQQALNISTTSTDWTPLANAATLSASNGQREHQLTFTGVDYTDRLQAGTKLKIPRTSTVPTQSAQFVAASSQYATKVSPVGMAQTNNITVEDMVSIDFYTDSVVQAKCDSTGSNGWRFSVNASGQLVMTGLNGSGNYRQVVSYQSLPLNKWVHVAATLDMSGWTTATNKLFIDGVDVPVQLNSAGTNPTSFSTAGDYAIGRLGASASNYFNGKIAQAKVWSVIRTAAQIRDNMNKELVGNETGLVGYWKLNGNFNDSTSNANNLTAAGGAIATYADNPFKATEYAIITGLSYTGGNTVATVFSGSNAIPNETLGSVSYSSARAPYGFPADKGKWTVTMLSNVTASAINAGAFNVWVAAFEKITVPTGSWNLGYNVNFAVSSSAAGALGGYFTLSSTTPVNNTYGIYPLGVRVYSGASVTDAISAASKSTSIFLAAQTVYTGYGALSNAGGSALFSLNGSQGATIFYAECAYL